MKIPTIRVETITDALLKALLVPLAIIEALYSSESITTLSDIDESQWVKMAAATLVAFIGAYQTLSMRRSIAKLRNTTYEPSN